MAPVGVTPKMLEALKGVSIASPLPSSAQYALVPRRAISEAAPHSKSACCAGVVQADDGLMYYIKENQNGKFTMASEWICTELAEAVGIAAPSAMPIQRLDGSLVFGSRLLGGLADQVRLNAYMTRQTLGQEVQSDLPRIISRIYAFDMMVSNEDRHLGNYLAVENNGRLLLYAFDYSHALFDAWPLHGYPNLGSRTRTVGRLLRMCHGFDYEAADELLGRLSLVTPEQMRSFMDRMPTDWLPSNYREGLIKFWAGPQRAERILTIRKGVSNGWLL